MSKPDSEPGAPNSFPPPRGPEDPLWTVQNRDADAENGLGDAVAEGKGGMN